MDPTYQDEDEENAALASFLGFSSFGSQNHAAKKRKFNPKTDAFVEGQELANIDRGGKKGRGSGGNDVPLGKQRVIGLTKPANGNEDEINLDDEDDDEEGGAPVYIDTSRPPPAETEREDTGPAYIDTSLPPPVTASTSTIPDAEATEMQERINRILASISSAPPPPGMDSMPASAHLPPPPPPGLDSLLTSLLPPTHLPNRPAFVPAQGHGRGRGPPSDTASTASGSRGNRGGGRGQRNERWYEGYYDPTFNENPWEALEKERGLEAVGTWVERVKR